VFGENSAGHSRDYSGVSPGYAHEVGERRAKKCALGVGLPGDTQTGHRRGRAVSYRLRLDLRFPFPTRERLTTAGESVKCFPTPEAPNAEAGFRPPLPCILSTAFCLLDSHLVTTTFRIACGLGLGGCGL
jgi:hypothetical protein